MTARQGPRTKDHYMPPEDDVLFEHEVGNRTLTIKDVRVRGQDLSVRIDSQRRRISGSALLSYKTLARALADEFLLVFDLTDDEVIQQLRTLVQHLRDFVQDLYDENFSLGSADHRLSGLDDDRVKRLAKSLGDILRSWIDEIASPEVDKKRAAITTDMSGHPALYPFNPEDDEFPHTAIFTMKDLKPRVTEAMRSSYSMAEIGRALHLILPRAEKERIHTWRSHRRYWRVAVEDLGLEIGPQEDS